MNQSTKTGTIGGTLFTLLTSVTSEDIFRTAVHAAIGAIVSLLISVICRTIWKKLKG